MAEALRDTRHFCLACDSETECKVEQGNLDACICRTCGAIKHGFHE